MSATHRLLRFGVFELNLDTEELRKEGLPIKLGPQPFKVLSILASRSGQIVARDEIREKIWGEETYVDFEHGLNQCIKQIRTALNDNTGRPLYIETIPRKGYRFLAPVTSKTIEVTPKVTPSTSGIQHKVELPVKPTSPYDPPPAQTPTATAVASAPENVVAPPQREAVLAPEALASEKGLQPDPSRRPRRSLLGWLAAALIMAVAVGFYWHSQKASPLTEKDTIVLADFDNSTGDSVFDSTLKEALAIDLDQSPYLNVLPNSKVREQTRLMGLSDEAALTASVARQVCQRAGSKAALFGSIAPLGSHYLVALSVENCNTGEVLAAVQGEADKREQISKVLHKSASTLREKLGESLASIQKYDMPIEQASTPSLEALKAYSLGLKNQDTGGGAGALPFYERAIDLDPEFAMAYARMGAVYFNLNEPTLAAENISRAFELRSRTSEKEKLLITGDYYLVVTGDLAKAIEAYTVFVHTYPREIDPRLNLSSIYTTLGKSQEALNQALAARALDPANGVTYVDSTGSYIALNRFDDARKVLEAAAARKLDDENLAVNAYVLGFLTKNDAEMKQVVASAAGKPGFEQEIMWMESETAAFHGRFMQARDYTNRAAAMAIREGSKERSATFQLDGALREIEVGNVSRGLQQVAGIEPEKTGKYNQVLLALALARGGDIKRSSSIADNLKQSYPFDTVIQYYWLPAIRAAIELDRNNPEQALKELEAAEPYELGAPYPYVAPGYPIYLRGMAYLRLGKTAEASTEFQKILQHSGVIQNFVLGALAELQLGRAQAAAGDKSAAAKSYQDFLATWSEADQDIPMLTSAKAEYSALNSSH